MDPKIQKIKLTEADKKIIMQNKNICTDLHGKGCDNSNVIRSNKNPN